MTEGVQDPTGIEIPTTRIYWSERQVQETKDEIDAIERTLSHPYAKAEDRDTARKQIKKLQRDMDAQSAPDTTPAQRDALAREMKELLEEIVPAMPSQEEMRKSPPGALGKELRFQAAMKSKVIRLKNIMRALHKGDPDPDISNIEKYRPVESTLNMDNALIPGKTHFVPPATQQYRDGYDRTFNGGTDAERALETMRHRLEELERRLESSEVPVTDEPAPAPVEKNFTHTSPCGRVAHGVDQHRADFGAAAHERQCKKCKALAEANPEG